MAVSITMVMLNGRPDLSVPAIIADLRETWSVTAEAPANGDDQASDEDSTHLFSVGAANVAIGVMPAPIPCSGLEGPCETSWLWPDAAAAVKPHTHHLIVALTADAPTIDRVTLLTQVTAAILKTCPAATGVYWGRAGQVIRGDVFREFAVHVLPKGPPVHLWIDFRVGANPDGTSWGFTAGLAEFDLMEFETTNASEAPGELRERLIGFAEYLIENGPVIGDGHTIGANADERIRVRYADSVFGRNAKVMRLDYSRTEPPAKRPWWKIR